MKSFVWIILPIITYFNLQTMNTVSEFKLQEYMGAWYEIARFQHRFEKDLECVTASYKQMDNGKIEVVNKGVFHNNPDSSKSITGKAWIPDLKEPGKLKVRFFWPFSAKYWVLYVDENYQYAIVGHPSRKYLWILSRNPIISDEQYKFLVEKAAEIGYKTENLYRVKQNCK
ncbi:MAG: hypothetical protein C0594_01645 [Marinilabiliales bacterium]|nr:MAG: hypothetical protein C0594_01645 [Marinilabiliales bacterium]